MQMQRLSEICRLSGLSRNSYMSLFFRSKTVLAESLEVAKNTGFIRNSLRTLYQKFQTKISEIGKPGTF